MYSLVRDRESHFYFSLKLRKQFSSSQSRTNDLTFTRVSAAERHYVRKFPSGLRWRLWKVLRRKRFPTRPGWASSEAKLQSVLHSAGTSARWRQGDLWFHRAGWLFLFWNSDCEGKFGLLRLLEPGQEVGGDVLGFDPWAAASLGFPSLVQGHVPLPACLQFCGSLTHRYYSCFLGISPWTYSHL